MAIKWREDLATGVEEIDNQHKELFNRVNSLLDACNQGKGKGEIGRIINFLDDYVVIHFGAEEALQRKYAYPDYLSHKALHTEFVKSFSDLRKQFETEGADLSLVLLTNRIVVDWLINHISKVDKALGMFLKTKMYL